MISLITESIVTLIFTYYLYNKYAEKSTKLPIKVLVLSVWFMTFLGVFLLPLDIYYSCYDQKEDPQEEDRNHEQHVVIVKNVIRAIWQIMYWVIYVLSWLVIPIFQEYEMAGDFSFSKKLSRSIKRNLLFYILIFLLGSLFVAYLILRQSFTMSHLTSFLVSTSNAWGVFLIIFLLGYGLVALPKNILLQSDALQRMRYLESFAKETQDDLNKKKDHLSLILNVREKHDFFHLFFFFSSEVVQVKKETREF